MDLFENRRLELSETEAPLAARMRPRTLDEFVGQAAIVGQGRLLRRAIQADQLSSLIFYGPPGTGKTTLARIIANTTKAHFIALNAVLAGVKDIRDAIATAQDYRGRYGQRTILFVDEVHRFNKSQQDALLPWVENGTVILIGATTENPYFEVNKALVSRSRIFQLKPLTSEDLKRVVEQTLSDRERGYGDRSIKLDADALDHLVNVANGDARTLLNALELAVETTLPDDTGTIHITLAVAEESIQQRAVLYDKEGDAHFDVISAFIKSLRGSDPDAALYWLARMVYAGEDPRFIFRRMLILAGEDVGLADPNAVVVVNACAQAFDRVGMPEGRYPLAQAALYLATAPKSNSVMGFFDALSVVEKEREAEVPLHLRDANRDKQGFGHGSGYLYPHSYREHWVEQQYLPGSLQGQVFYQPSEQGFEHTIREKVARDREAQLAALVEGIGVAMPEGLSMSPANSSLEKWVQRALSQTGEKLGNIRDRMFAIAAPQRHHVILDLNAGSGLLTWEAVRQVPEGGVYAWVRTEQDFTALTEQAATLPELVRPIAIRSLEALDVQFDRILGRNILQTELDKLKIITELSNLLMVDGKIVLAESVPQSAQRLYQLIDPGGIKRDLYSRLVKAEEAIYTCKDNPKINWSVDDLRTLFEQTGLRVEITAQQSQTKMYLSQDICDRWFTTNSQQPTYADHLAKHLSTSEIAQIRQLFLARLRNQTVDWSSTIAFVVAYKPQ